VYLLGINRNNLLTVWKDSVAHPFHPYNPEISLQSELNANALFVSGNDFYVVGYSPVEGASYARATLWKNGIPTQLETVASVARAIFVSGNDVYVAGTIGADSGRRPVLWKNGERQVLGQSRGDASWVPTHVSVWGKDVYVGGVGAFGGNNRPAMLWKNGEEKVIPLNKNNTGSWSDGSNFTVFVSDGDVYVTAQNPLGFWKNGQVLTINNFGIDKTLTLEDLKNPSIYASGKDWYLAGTYSSYSSQTGTRVRDRVQLWKNGVQQKLQLFENPETLAEIPTKALQVFVVGSDVYVLGVRDGYDAGGRRHNAVLVLWKNGIAQTLPYILEDTSNSLNIHRVFIAN
jgi:hypothetical protein